MSKDGFSACVGISSIELNAGLIGKSRYDSVQIEMSGVIAICADAGYDANKSDTMRKITAVNVIAKFGEDSRASGVPNDLTSVCIGVMNVRVMDESDSRRSCDIYADLRVTLPWDFLPHFLTLREHHLEVAPSFYRETDRDDKKTKNSGYGSITSYITSIRFSPVMPDVKEPFNVCH